MKPEPPRRGDFEGLAHGMQLAVTVALGLTVGYGVDRRYHTSPWGVVLGFLGGAALGFYHLARAFR